MLAFIVCPATASAPLASLTTPRAALASGVSRSGWTVSSWPESSPSASTQADFGRCRVLVRLPKRLLANFLSTMAQTWVVVEKAQARSSSRRRSSCGCGCGCAESFSCGKLLALNVAALVKERWRREQVVNCGPGVFRKAVSYVYELCAGRLAGFIILCLGDDAEGLGVHEALAAPRPTRGSQHYP